MTANKEDGFKSKGFMGGKRKFKIHFAVEIFRERTCSNSCAWVELVIDFEPPHSRWFVLIKWPSFLKRILRWINQKKSRLSDCHLTCSLIKDSADDHSNRTELWNNTKSKLHVFASKFTAGAASSIATHDFLPSRDLGRALKIKKRRKMRNQSEIVKLKCTGKG